LSTARNAARSALVGWIVGVGSVLGLPVAGFAAGQVVVIDVSGTINPASSDYIQRAIADAEAEGAAALLMALDTPGGLVASTKDIIQAILNSPVPIIVYVSPQGAWAGSAGTFITLAGHVAAMAPGTSIGAAHPVGIGGGGGESEDDKEGEKGGKTRDVAGEKAENLLAAFIESIAKERDRNVEWAIQAVRESVAVSADEALELGVIDLIAPNQTALLELVSGRAVETTTGEIVLELGDAPIEHVVMTPFQRFLHVLASPDVAVLLMMAGLLGLYIEFSQPGLLIPGAIGAACLILGLIALQILPFSWLGLILFFLGLGLLVAEVFVTSYGVLFISGIVCLLLGGTMIFDMPEVSDLRVSFWSVLLPAVAGFGFFAAVVLFGVTRSLGRAQTAGVAELMGMQGRAETAMAEAGATGTVFIRGEFWNASAEQPIGAGDAVEVTQVEGLQLRVRPRKRG